ncbi:MBL fold metallo-hydrolase [Paremcibacter congregatus]|nr:MBL fold metallo-hydrolase [Paremcibacter congregatus]
MLRIAFCVFLLVGTAASSSAADKMQVVMLGTGTPNADPDRSGPAVAIVMGNQAYLVDAGPGVVRRAAAAARNGVVALEADKLNIVFLSHLHSDHTLGLPDLIFTPWVLERVAPLKLFGPKGTQDMANHLQQAYSEDIHLRLEGLEPANEEGYKTDVTEIDAPGVVYQDAAVTVEAIPVLHGSWETPYGYKFSHKGQTIVISGDARPSPALIEAATGVDILVHEVYSAEAYKSRPPVWQKYHAQFHTSTIELAEIAQKTKPKLLVLYHQLYWGRSDEDLIREIREAGYTGQVISATDLDIY